MYNNVVKKAMWAGALGSVAFTVSLLAVLNAMPALENGNGYGLVMFVATPIFHGMAIGVISQVFGLQPWRVVLQATLISIGLLGLGMLVFRYEGAICLLMAAPLVVPLIFLGAWMGWAIRQRSRSALASLPTVGALGLAIGGGAITGAPEATGEVRTSWWVAAPPEKVWPHLLQMDSMREPEWWLFRLGVSHTLSIETRADGERTSQTSTGPLVAKVTMREENHRLAYRVVSTPPSMKELNPFGEVNPAHLTSAYRSGEGDFRLTPERGGTRIDVWSSYAFRMGPTWYWRLWSDAVVYHLQERIVTEIRRKV